MTSLPCICPPDIYPGGYAVGCPFHEQAELDKGPTATRKTWTAVQVTYYHGEVHVSKPVRGSDGHIWSQQHTITCDHNHTTPEAAERCAAKLSWKEQVK